MAKAKKKPGPKLTDPPHLIEIKQRIEARGMGSLKEAHAAMVKALGPALAKKRQHPPSYDAIVTFCRDGLPPDARESQIEALRWLEILELVPRRESA